MLYLDINWIPIGNDNRGNLVNVENLDTKYNIEKNRLEIELVKLLVHWFIGLIDQTSGRTGEQYKY